MFAETSSPAVEPTQSHMQEVLGIFSSRLKQVSSFRRYQALPKRWDKTTRRHVPKECNLYSDSFDDLSCHVLDY